MISFSLSECNQVGTAELKYFDLIERKKEKTPLILNTIIAFKKQEINQHWLIEDTYNLVLCIYIMGYIHKWEQCHSSRKGPKASKRRVEDSSTVVCG